jgi:hypothetical protein
MPLPPSHVEHDTGDVSGLLGAADGGLAALRFPPMPDDG